jgi:rhamnose transport system permease protein
MSATPLSSAPPAAPRYAVADAPPRRFSDFALRWETILVALLVLSVVVNSWLSPYFLDRDNLLDSTFNYSEKAMIAIGMALLIMVRDIDLSVAAIVALCSLVMGFAASFGADTGMLFLIALGVGALCGVFNGLLTTALALPSIVVTIGTMSLFRGLAQVALGDQAFTQYPPGILAIGQGYIGWGIPNSFVTFLALALVVGIVLHRTPLGRRIFAIGANPEAARFSGIPVARLRFGLFVFSGLLSGLAAFFLTGRIGSTRPNIALGWELEAVTMVILGGVSIAGGSGTIPGVVLAVFVLGLTTFGMTLVNVPGIVINVLIGALLIVTLAAPILARRWLNRRR